MSGKRPWSDAAEAVVSKPKRKRRAWTRVEFRLTMPGRASWNGRWSGEDKNYTTTRNLGPEAIERMFCAGHGPDDERASWSHNWSDGWCAVVEARIVPPRERLRKSDGFNGYEWMVDNIVRYGSTREPKLVAETTSEPVVKCSACSSPATRRDAFDVADVCDYCGEASDDQKRDREKRQRRMAEREEI